MEISPEGRFCVFPLFCVTRSPSCLSLVSSLYRHGDWVRCFSFRCFCLTESPRLTRLFCLLLTFREGGVWRRLKVLEKACPSSVFSYWFLVVESNSHTFGTAEFLHVHSVAPPSYGFGLSVPCDIPRILFFDFFFFTTYNLPPPPNLFLSGPLFFPKLSWTHGRFLFCR